MAGELIKLVSVLSGQRQLLPRHHAAALQELPFPSPVFPCLLSDANHAAGLLLRRTTCFSSQLAGRAFLAPVATWQHAVLLFIKIAYRA
jgi:hypothetical protein